MKRNKFDLSHGDLTTLGIGYLTPVTWYETLPGDSILAASSHLMRIAPMNAPVMGGRLKWKKYSFFVPLRLIWDEDDFESFITGGADGNDTTVPPTITGDVTVSSLLDQLDLPPKYDGTGASRTFSALPVRAYQLIYNTYFRDKDLNTASVISTASGPDTTTDITLQLINFAKDYLTTCRPWQQLGDAESVPVSGTGTLNFPSAVIPGSAQQVIGVVDGSLGTMQALATSQYLRSAANPSTNQDAYLVTEFNQDTLSGTVDISSLEVSVEDLRLTNAKQRFKEARAMYGHEYSDYLAFLGVTSSDARLRKPEYLGGNSGIVQISEVLQTSPTDGSTSSAGVADMFGHGIGAQRGRPWMRYFEEHGIVMDVIAVYPDAIYSNAQPRKFNRTTKELYWQKEQEFIGQAEVLNGEVYADQSSGGGGFNGIFGYNDHYDEYKSIDSVCKGAFRTTLSYWTLARQFVSDVVLNSDFISVLAVQFSRIFQVTNDPMNTIWLSTSNHIKARRLLSRGATPILK